MTDTYESGQRWAVLKVHDERPEGDDPPGRAVVVGTAVYGPYATQRAASMVARGLNVEARDTPDRFVPIVCAPVNGWTWDGLTPAIEVDGPVAVVSTEPMPVLSRYYGDDDE